MIYEKISGFTDEINSNLEEQIAAAKNIGLDYICMRNVYGKNICEYLPDQVEEKILPILKQNNIRVSSIGSPLGKILADDSAAFDAQLLIAEQAAHTAHILNCRYIRIFSFYIPDGSVPENWTDTIVKKIQRYVDIFEKYGVTALHENEKEIYGDTAKRCKNLFESVNSQHFRGIFDFANFVQCQQNVREAYDILEEYIEYFHIKDAYYENGETEVCGKGDGEIENILKSAFDGGFRGFLTLEPHLAVFDGLASLERREVNEIIHKNKAKDGFEAFVMQYEALDMILKRLY